MSGTKNIVNRMRCLSLLASMGFAALLSLEQTDAALAATAPNLLSESTYGVVSSTFTDTVAGSTINGDVCYTTGPAVNPTISGTTVTPCPNSTGVDQGNARANLLGQPCTPLGAAVALNAVIIGANPPGTFPPGCYSSTGAMSVTTGTTVTLSGAGVYIFRPGGALNTAANSNVVAAGGACASDVFWAPLGATTIGANSNFVGNILAPAADITIGSSVNFEGRALAYGQTVTIDTDTITVPTCAPFGCPTITLLPAPPLPQGTVGVAYNQTITAIGGTGPYTFSMTAGALPTGLSPLTSGGLISGTPTAAGTFTFTVTATDANGCKGLQAYTVTIAVPVAPTAIPTLSEWGVIIFMVLVGFMSIYYLRRQKAKA